MEHRSGRSGVMDASALNYDALRLFCGEEFLGVELKTPIVPPVHAKSAYHLGPRALYFQTAKAPITISG